MTEADKELIIRSNQGDISAFEQLVFKYDRIVFSVILKYIKDNDEAKDIYQEVFIRAFRGLKKFRFQSEFSTWLYRIAANVCLSYIGKQKRNPVDPFLQSDENENAPDKAVETLSPENQYEKKEMMNAIEQAVNELSPRQRMSFILKHYEGYKINEIAEIMGCGEGTIKKYLFESIRKLKNQLYEFA
ncbi:MAG: RNA polymerase sigma factor RpoE [Ignavibacteriaceae bacterium]